MSQGTHVLFSNYNQGKHKFDEFIIGIESLNVKMLRLQKRALLDNNFQIQASHVVNINLYNGCRLI